MISRLVYRTVRGENILRLLLMFEEELPMQRREKISGISSGALPGHRYVEEALARHLNSSEVLEGVPQLSKMAESS